MEVSGQPHDSFVQWENIVENWHLEGRNQYLIFLRVLVTNNAGSGLGERVYLFFTSRNYEYISYTLKITVTIAHKVFNPL
jgi:hypothetical protein